MISARTHNSHHDTPNIHRQSLPDSARLQNIDLTHSAIYRLINNNHISHILKKWKQYENRKPSHHFSTAALPVMLWYRFLLA